MLTTKLHRTFIEKGKKLIIKIRRNKGQFLPPRNKNLRSIFNFYYFCRYSTYNHIIWYIFRHNCICTYSYIIANSYLP